MQNLETLLEADNAHFEALASAPRPVFAAEPEVATAQKKGKGRKSVSQAQRELDLCLLE